MLVLFLFLATAFYSIAQTLIIERGIEFGRFQTSFTENEVIISAPITVNNTGQYDIGEFKITTTLFDSNGKSLVSHTTFLGEISSSNTETKTHILSICFLDILSNMTYLWFEDAEFRMDSFFQFRYAYALCFKISLKNLSIPWGAPLSGFNVTDIYMASSNGTHIIFRVGLEIENHSSLNIGGILDLKFYNEADKYLGSGETLFQLPTGQRFCKQIESIVELTDPLSLTDKGYVTICLRLPMVACIELGRIGYG
jgi:hypothetical protein